MTKFKKLNNSDKIVLNNGYFSNGHFLFKSSWIASTKTKTNLALRNRLKREQTKQVTEKMNGTFQESRHDLEKFVSEIDLKNYSEFNLKNAKEVLGYKHGKIENCGMPVKLKLGKTCLDIEYAASLFFDIETQVFVSKEKNKPVVIKLKNEIVGLVMPLQETK